MKKFVFLLVCLLMLVAISLHLLSEPLTDDAFNENIIGILDVVLRDKMDSSLQYRAIGPGQSTKTIDPFESDPLQVFHLANKYEIHTVDGKIHFSTADARLEDESGNKVEITPAFQRILDLTTEIDHDILETYILKQGAHLFAAVELNVNLWTPCVLYYYDSESDALVELITYDSMDYIGLRIRNMNNIHAAALQI